MLISDLDYIDATGYHYADFPTHLAWIQDAYKEIYGTDVYLGSDSQDGQFLALLAQAFYDTAALGASIYSSFSPTTAQGVGLSRVVKINGVNRRGATHSTVEVVLVGVAGTIITGGIAVDTLQQQWSIPTTTIPLSGTITVTATAVLIGSIAALPNTITGIFTPTQGWQTVNNPAGATLGIAVESDAELRTKQAASVANPSLTVLEGTIGAVSDTLNVTKVAGYENDTGATDGNGLPPHSISIVAQGGLDTDVARAIQVHKTPGTQTYGTTTVPLTDSHGMPININFYRPTQATIGVRVTLTPLTGWTADYEALIQEAVAAAVLLTPIGGSIIITKLYVIAYLVGTPAYGSFNIVSIELKKNAGAFGTVDINLLFNEVAVCVPGTDVVIVT
jgi:uncharacterized phage protein gp47/JayE